ncbi:unnamed protein product [Paramecium pentaurelia]|uniref:Uncharacterized protein n=1 Tax=Paramecium pentaurelia TaxID=43138 RepID=A0A8S1WHY8_9CILI|nr:unnamed protein product [Paramecium pentaurelia]
MFDSQNSTSAKLTEQIKSQQSYKIREFEWFEVETKIRLFVQKLMEPTLKQMHEDRMIVDELQQNFKTNNKEVSYLRDIVLNQGAGIPIFEEFKQRFLDLEMKLDQQKRESIDQFGNFRQSLDSTDNEISKFLQSVRTLEYFKIKLEQDLQDIQIKNDNFKSSVESIIKQLSSDLTESTKNWKLTAIEIEQQFGKVDNRHSDLINIVKQEQVKLKQISDSILEINKKQNQNINTFEVIDTRLIKADVQITTLKKQILEVDQLINRNKQVQMFLIYYLPMYMQAQISDSLFTCLPLKFFYKFTQFEKQKFDYLDKQLLEYNGDPNIQILIDEYSKTLAEVMKRNSRISQMIFMNQKKEQKDSHSSDSDMDSDNRSQRTNVRNSVQIRQDSTNNHRKESIYSKDMIQQSAIMQQQKKNSGQSNNSNLIFYEDQIKQIKDQFQQEIDELKQFNITLKKQIVQNQKETNDQISINISSCQSNNQKLLNTTTNQIKNLEENIKKALSQENSNSNDLIFDQVKQFKKSLQTILHFLVLITHLLIQDEIDRQGIQLMGAKDTQIDGGLVYTGQSKKGPSIQLNGECLSCSGQSIQLLQCFKLACLAYHPSDILVDGKLFKRDQLLEMCTTLLRQAKQEFLDQDQNISQPNTQPIASRQRSSSIPISPGRLNSNFKFNKTRKLAPMTNIQNL